jgi:hypothetical protein
VKKKKKSPNLPGVLINQLSKLGAPLSISKAKFYHLHTSSGLSPSTSHSLGLPLLSVPTADPPSPLIKASRDTHTPPPIWGMVASVCGLWPQCGHLETTQAITLKSGSSMTLLQFLNLPGCGENCIRKFSCFRVRVGACCTGLPAGLPIKENPGEPGFQSAASDGHRHTPRGHNLNYTIWTLYAESVSSHQAPFTQGRAFPIYQATLGAPFSRGRAPFPIYQAALSVP